MTHAESYRIVRSPWFIGAVALLVLNDHVLKAAYPGVITGKLSDIAGMAFFPMLLTAIWSAIDANQPPIRVALAISAIATSAVFVSIKTLPTAGLLYQWGLGALQWPWRALAGCFGANPHLPSIAPVQLVQDATDLFALPFVLIGPCVCGFKATTRHSYVLVRGRYEHRRVIGAAPPSAVSVPTAAAESPAAHSSATHARA